MGADFLSKVAKQGGRVKFSFEKGEYWRMSPLVWKGWFSWARSSTRWTITSFGSTFNLINKCICISNALPFLFVHAPKLIHMHVYFLHWKLPSLFKTYCTSLNIQSANFAKVHTVHSSFINNPTSLFPIFQKSWIYFTYLCFTTRHLVLHG